MSELYDTCKEQFLLLRKSLRDKLADKKLDFVELIGLYRDFSHAGAAIAEVLNAPGADKRALVIEAALAWWDEELEELDIPWVPDVVADPIIRLLIPVIVGYFVDLIVDQFNRDGWPEKVG